MKEIAVRLDGVNEVPRILVDGKEITQIVSIKLDWKTSGLDEGKCFIKVKYCEENFIKCVSVDRLGSPSKGGDVNDKEKGTEDN